jgi:putative ribosome biogenesis GTPase RsgA
MENKDYIIDREHSFAGLYPFQETDSDYFFGRDREIDDLFGLIQKKVLTVVFGKSGVGKTSLSLRFPIENWLEL